MSGTEKIVLPDDDYAKGPKKKKDDDIIGEYRQEVTEGDHGLEGDKSGISTAITFIVALAWSLFQMSTASWLLLDSLYVKAFHLAFAMALVFLNIPAIKGANCNRWDLRILLAMNRVTLFDWAVGLVAVAAALYVFFDYDGIADRAGQPNARDIVIGLILLVTLLEATRRVSGPALPIISLLFIAYVFFGSVCL